MAGEQRTVVEQKEHSLATVNVQARRAPQACSTCRVRKRACDKDFPRCGYCTARDLHCVFDRLQDSTPTVAGPGQWRIWSPDKSTQSTPRSLNSLEDKSPATSVVSGILATVPDPSTLRTTLLGQLDQILQAGKVSMTDMIEQYLIGIFTWLPVLPLSCLDYVRNATTDQHAPPGTMIVALALCLVSLPSAPRAKGPTVLDVNELYLRVKLMMVQTELLQDRSHDAIRAGVLIAAHEYGTGQFLSAWETVGKLMRAWHVLTMGHLEGATPASKDKDESTQRRDTLWCLLILER
jgi:hypothetical protein